MFLKKLLDTNLDELFTALKKKYPKKAIEGQKEVYNKFTDAGFDIGKMENDYLLSVAEQTDENLVEVTLLSINIFRKHKTKFFNNLVNFIAVHTGIKEVRRRGIENSKLTEFSTKYPYTLRTVIKIMFRRF